MPRSTTQSRSSSQVDHSQQFSQQDIQKMTSDVVFYLLAQESKRIPQKRSDIVKNCGLSNKPSDIREIVLRKSAETLLHVFGIECKEISAGNHQYLLINRMTADGTLSESHHLKWTDAENAHLGLLYTILGLIFMSNDAVRNDVLFRFLKQLGVYDDFMEEKSFPGRRRTLDDDENDASSVSNPVRELFGNVKDLIHKEWGAKQHYLSITKVESADPEQPVYEYKWGERAKLEIKKSRILATICQMYDCSPNAFKEQYRRVVEEEGEEALQE